jgi:hypothetical protein
MLYFLSLLLPDQVLWLLFEFFLWLLVLLFLLLFL